MYEITKARMLLTTAAFAAVAVVFAGGANARIPEEDGSGIGAEPVAVVAPTVDPLASSRLTALFSSLSAQERSYLKSMSAVCSVVLCQPDEWLTARLGFATRAGNAQTRTKFPDGYRGDQLDPAIRTAITTRVAETTAMPWTILDLSDSALAKSNGRYTKSARALRTAQAKFCGNMKLVHDMNEEALDQGWSQDAMVALFQSEIIANRHGCAWVQ